MFILLQGKERLNRSGSICYINIFKYILSAYPHNIDLCIQEEKGDKKEGFLWWWCVNKSNNQEHEEKCAWFHDWLRIKDPLCN